MIAQRYMGTILDDRLLAGWFGRLHLDGDWANCFMQPPGGIGWFYAYFQRDVQLWYVKDELDGELLLAGWFEPMHMGGAFFSLWVHPAHRRSRRMLQAYGELLEYALERTHIILGITKQEHLLDAHRKMGYTVVGQVPGLWGLEAAWLVSLTKAQLDGGYYGHGRRREERRTLHSRVRVPTAASRD